MLCLWCLGKSVKDSGAFGFRYFTSRVLEASEQS